MDDDYRQSKADKSLAANRSVVSFVAHPEMKNVDERLLLANETLGSRWILHSNKPFLLYSTRSMN